MDRRTVRRHQTKGCVETARCSTSQRCRGGETVNNWITKTDIVKSSDKKNVYVVIPMAGAATYYPTGRSLTPAGVNKVDVPGQRTATDHRRHIQHQRTQRRRGSPERPPPRSTWLLSTQASTRLSPPSAGAPRPPIRSAKQRCAGGGAARSSERNQYVGPYGGPGGAHDPTLNAGSPARYRALYRHCPWDARSHDTPQYVSDPGALLPTSSWSAESRGRGATVHPEFPAPPRRAEDPSDRRHAARRHPLLGLFPGYVPQRVALLLRQGPPRPAPFRRLGLRHRPLGPLTPPTGPSGTAHWAPGTAHWAPGTAHWAPRHRPLGPSGTAHWAPPVSPTGPPPTPPTGPPTPPTGPSSVIDWAHAVAAAFSTGPLSHPELSTARAFGSQCRDSGGGYVRCMDTGGRSKSSHTTH